MEAWLNTVQQIDVLDGIARIHDQSLNLIIADPPYGLGKDFGNESDKRTTADYLAWMQCWVDAVIPKLTSDGSLYIFVSWGYRPKIFCYLKTQLMMVNG